MSESNTGSYQADLIEKMDHRKYVRSSRTRRRTVKIVALSIALALSLLILIVVSIYSSVKISSTQELNRQLERSLADANEQLEKLQPELERVSADLDALVNERIPNLNGLVSNQMIGVENPYANSILFTVIKQGKRQFYKYLLVVENNTDQKIKPSFRVLLFDQYGVHIATDESHDETALAPGESRDYASEIEFFFDTEPKHFKIDDLTAESASGS